MIDQPLDSFLLRMTTMTHHRWHLLEKLQVEVAAAVGLVLMYFVAWPMLRPWDPDGAVVFLPHLAIGRLVVFALAVWAVTALCTLLTLTARPEGSLLAALVAVGAISLRSGPIRLLLMRYQHDFSHLYSPLIAELFALAVVLIGTGAVVLGLRRAVRNIKPGWIRPESISLPAAKPVKGKKPAGKSGLAGQAVSFAASCAITILVAVVMLAITLFSADRGQILFGLAVSFFAGSALAQYLFPNRNAGSNCLAVLLLGIVFYAKACLVPGGDLAWVNIDPIAQALPVDWLAAGCGGAVGGFWLSSRLHDAKHLGNPQATPSEE